MSRKTNCARYPQIFSETARIGSVYRLSYDVYESAVEFGAAYADEHDIEDFGAGFRAWVLLFEYAEIK